MAKRNRVASGLTIKDIQKMSMDKFQKYTPAQQRELVSRLASAGNKRLRNFDKAGIETPATIKLNLSGGKLSVRGKSGDELIKEFYRAKNFLNSPTSTKTGWKKTKDEIQKTVSDIGKIYKGMDYNEAIANAFAYYDALSEIDPTLTMNRDKYKVTEKIAEMMKNGVQPEEIINKSTIYLMDLYDAEQTRYNETIQPLGNDITPNRYRRK